MRGLPKEFINDLNSMDNDLNLLLKMVREDDTLCLEIRDNYINIYYRGGNIIKIDNKNGRYKLYFDINFTNKMDSIDINLLKDITKDCYNVTRWVENIYHLKRAIDSWLKIHPKLEREFQQVLLRENNYTSISNSTDYFISDIEYASSENKSRFDLVGVKCASKGHIRSSGKNISLAIFEMKYGDKALTGSAGIDKHIKDLYKFCTTEDALENLMNETEILLNQKIDLGLVRDINKNIKICRDTKPEYIFIFANHDPEKGVLLRELKRILETNEYKELLEKVDIKVAKSSYMGYGLYEDNIINLDEILKTKIK